MEGCIQMTLITERWKTYPKHNTDPTSLEILYFQRIGVLIYRKVGATYTLAHWLSTARVKLNAMKRILEFMWGPLPPTRSNSANHPFPFIE